jgi:hypothetical protein
MHARVTHSKADPAKAEEGIRMVKEKAVPSAKKQAGFKGGYWLFDRKTGKGIAVTLWENERAMQSSDATAKQLVDQLAQVGTSSLQILNVEHYEVVAQA